MEKAEKLMEAIAGMTFYRELALEDLCFAPAVGSDPESVELILTLGDLGILFNYIKPEDLISQTLDEAFRSSRERIAKAVRDISAGSLPAYRNSRGQYMKMSRNTVMFALIVVDDEISGCPRILNKEKDQDVVINCITETGFRQVCKALISPMELMHYLYYRERFYARRPEQNMAGEAGEPVMSLFLSDRYGYRDSNRPRFHLDEFRQFLMELPAHIHGGEDACSLAEVSLFLTHLSREEAAAFIERMKVLIMESRRGASGMLSSLRPRDDRYAVFFVGKDAFPMTVIRNMFCGKSNVRKVMEIITHHSHDEEYQVEFLLEDVA